MGFSFAAKKILIVGSGLSGAVVANENVKPIMNKNTIFLIMCIYNGW
jgi:UDP-galactopyranose mutase